VELGQAILEPKPKRSLLPVLVVLFIIAYALMTSLIVEQGSVIESQRYLIKQLFYDSGQLTALKGKLAANAAKNGNAAQAKPSAPVKPSPAPSTKERAEDCRTCKARRHAEPREMAPPVPASDREDVRRALISI
jgi:hypothetical protein